MKKNFSPEELEHVNNGILLAYGLLKLLREGGDYDEYGTFMTLAYESIKDDLFGMKCEDEKNIFLMCFGANYYFSIIVGKEKAGMPVPVEDEKFLTQVSNVLQYSDITKIIEMYRHSHIDAVETWKAMKLKKLL